MNNDPNIFYNPYELSAYHVNMHGNVTMPMLVNFLIETASSHADRNGFGFQHIMKTQKTWVLSSVKIQMERLPRYLEKIYIKTWVRGFERIFFERCFQILDADQQVLGAANTYWVSIDLKSRRPVPAEQVEHGLEYHPEMLALNEPLSKLPDLKQTTDGSLHTVKFSDLDINRHMTTVRYIDLLIDNYPYEFLNVHIPTRLEVHFMKENVVGQQLLVQTEQKSENEFLHRLWRKDDSKEVSRASIVWKHV